LGDRDKALECLDKAIEARDARLTVQAMREIDFYADRARQGKSPHFVPVRAIAARG
jgi:hypothetical protein